ncbi:MAG: hypothetical protein AB8G05_13635 [Oligoflexales bacterium]
MFIKKKFSHSIKKLIILNLFAWLTCHLQASESESYHEVKESSALADEYAEDETQPITCKMSDICTQETNKSRLEPDFDTSVEDNSSEKIIVFACKSNSCRSQMAEAWAHEWLKNQQNELPLRVYSVALNEEIMHQEKKPVIKPAAIEALAVSDIDIETQYVKTLNEVARELSVNLSSPRKHFDKLIVLCSCEGPIRNKLEQLSRSVHVWNIEAPSSAPDKDQAYLRVSFIIRDRVFQLMDQLIEDS